MIFRYYTYEMTIMKTSVGYWEKFMSQCVESDLFSKGSISVCMYVGVCVGNKWTYCLTNVPRQRKPPKNKKVPKLIKISVKLTSQIKTISCPRYGYILS